MRSSRGMGIVTKGGKKTNPFVRSTKPTDRDPNSMPVKGKAKPSNLTGGKDPSFKQDKPKGGNPFAQGYAAGGSLDISAAIKKPGALHAQMGVPAGKKIPAKALATAAKAPGKLGQRARFAETLKGFNKKK